MLTVRLRGTTSSSGPLCSLLVRKDFASFRAIGSGRRSSCHDDILVALPCASACSNSSRYTCLTRTAADSFDKKTTSFKSTSRGRIRALSNSTTITATQLIAAEAMPQLWMYPPEGDEDHGKEEDYSNSTSYATTGGYTPYTPKCTTTLSNATTSTSPTNNSNKPSNTSKGGGGSKDGRIKCPKCGQHVLFQHADFEENTFYCATCSSWFLVAPSSDSSKITNTTPLDYQQQQQRSSNSNGSSVGNVKENFPLERERQYNTSKSYVDKNNSTTTTATAATFNSPKSHDSDKYVQYSSINSETIASKQDHHPSSKIRPAARTIPTPIEICNGLDEYVIGQKKC